MKIFSHIYYKFHFQSIVLKLEMFHPAGFSDSSCDDDGWFDADEKPRSQYFPEDER